MKKRLLSLFLALVMVGSTLSVCASAANTGNGTVDCAVTDSADNPVSGATVCVYKQVWNGSTSSYDEYYFGAATEKADNPGTYELSASGFAVNNRIRVAVTPPGGGTAVPAVVNRNGIGAHVASNNAVCDILDETNYGYNYDFDAHFKCQLTSYTNPSEPDPVTPVIYTLKYDLQGGNGSFADQTDTNSVGSSTFTVPGNEPTKDGFHFCGWAESADGPVAYTAGGINNTVTITSDAPTKTIYAVWLAHANVEDAEANSDGLCSVCGECMHTKVNGYCTETDCTHGNDCCSKPEETPDPVNTFPVTFNANGGTIDGIDDETTTRSATQGQSYPEFPAVTYEGHDLLGWFTDSVNGSKVEAGDTVTASAAHTLYAHWQCAHEHENYYGTVYCVEENCDHDDCCNRVFPDSYIDCEVKDSSGTPITNAVVQVFKSLKSENYETQHSIGLATFDDGTGKYVLTVNYDDFAAGDRIAVAVAYLDGSGTPQSGLATVASYGANAAPVGDKEKALCIVKMMYPNYRTFDAHFSYTVTTECTVTFDVNGGNAVSPESKTVTVGEAYGELPTPTRTGFKFKGWFVQGLDGAVEIKSTSTVSVPKNHTLTAEWEANEYTIVYHGNGGRNTNGHAQITATGKIDQDVTLKTNTRPNRFKREGYTFAGWSLEATGSVDYNGGVTTRFGVDNLNEADGKLHLYAIWTPNKYTVTFNANGGNVVSPATTTVTYDSAYGTLPTPSRTGHDFLGWFTDAENGTQVTDETIVKTADNHTLYAHWEAHKNTVTYKITGKWFTTDTELNRTYANVPYGKVLAGLSNSTDRDGYTFHGWYINGDPEKPFVPGETTMPDSALTITGYYTKGITVEIYGNTRTVPYNSEEFNVSGYTTVPAALPEGVTITFNSGKPYASGHFVGTYYGNMVASDFAVDGGDAYDVTVEIKQPVTLTINPMTITDDMIQDIAAVTYSGTAQTPDVVVKATLGYDGRLGQVELTKDTDYTVSYSNNINAGTATVTVTGKGNFTGTATKNFTINKAEPTLEWSVPTGVVYDGNAHAATWKATGVDGKDIAGASVAIKYYNVVEGNVDRTSEFVEAPVNAGNYAAAIYLRPTTNYNSKWDGHKQFTIEPADISEATITLNPTSCTYTSEECTPTETVTWNSMTLVKGTDYTVSYESNVNVGTATVTITGIGNFKNTATEEFTIEPADISEATITLNPTSYVYNTDERKPAVTVTWKGKTLEKDTDYTVAYSDNTNAGTATVTITGKGNFTGTKDATFTITAAPLADGNVALEYTEKDWTGSALTPTVTVKYTHEGKSEITLEKDKDYTVSYTNNTNVGTATVAVTGKGNYSGTVNKTFTIQNASYTGTIQFTVKTGSSNGNKPVQGAVFGLYTDKACSSSNRIQSATSDADGVVSFTRTEVIAPNATVIYYVKQISAPSGYSKDSRTYQVVLTPVAGTGTFTFTKTALTSTSTYSTRTASYSAQTLSVNDGISVLSDDGDFENPPIDSGSNSGSTSTGNVVSVVTVTFMDGDEYDLEAQKGTTLNKDGSIAITLSGAKVPESKIPDVIAADAYYRFAGWAVENKYGELEEIDLETYKFTTSTKVYALMADLWTPYTDMKQDRSDWYYQYARDLSIAGVVNGVPGGAFAPAEEVTWGVALKLVMLAVGYDEQAKTGSHWASGYLTAALRDGLVTDASIDLNATLTRIEYAYLAVRAMGLKEVKMNSPYMDTSDPAVLALYKAGIMEGTNSPIGRMFNPDSNITRAEMSAIIWRINKYED